MNYLYKIVILTPLWKRHDVFQFYIDRFKRIKQYKKKFKIDIVVVGSEGLVTRDLCEKSGFYYLESSNQPLGRKLNYGMKFCKQLKPDYVMGVGSDDIMSESLLDFYLESMDKGIDFIGLLDCYFYDLLSKRLIYWGGYTNHRIGETIGTFRMLSSRLLGALNWEPWDSELSKSLDGSMMKKLAKINYNKISLSVKNADVLAVDLKNEFSINKFRIFENSNEMDDLKFFKKYLKEIEYKSIMSYEKSSG